MQMTLSEPPSAIRLPRRSVPAATASGLEQPPDNMAN
jgi:hypothetical protein